MALVSFKIKQSGLENVQAYIKGQKSKMLDLAEPLKKAGVYMLRSVDENFKKAGRPSPWRPLSRSTLIYKLRHGYSHLPLTKSGHLRRSITSRVNKNRLLIGTSTPYAAVHQFGGRHMPKRQFLLFQDIDIKRIGELIIQHMTKEK